MRDGQLLRYSTDRQKTPDGPSEIIGVPVFHEGRVYVAIGQSPLHGDGQGCLSCVDAATGTKVWDSRLIERSLATPAIAGGLLYIPDCAGNLHCFDAGTGERYWMHSLESKTWGASAFVADDKVFVGTEEKMLWVFQRANRQFYPRPVADRLHHSRRCGRCALSPDADQTDGADCEASAAHRQRGGEPVEPRGPFNCHSSPRKDGNPGGEWC